MKSNTNKTAKLINNIEDNGYELPRCYKEAIKYWKEDLVVIPVPRGKKGTHFQWKEYQECRPTIEEIKECFSKDINIAVLCGCPSGGLVVFDFDEKNWKMVYDKFIKRFPRLANTRKVITGSGKVHLWVRVPDLPLNISRIVRKFDEAKVELRANGHYVMAPPSIHPSGKRYRFDDVDVPMIELSMNKLKKIIKWFKPGKEEQKENQEEKQSTAKIIPINDEQQKEATEYYLKRALATATIGSRNDTGFWLACQLRDLGISKAEAKSTIEKYAGGVPQNGEPQIYKTRGPGCTQICFWKISKKAWNPQ